MLASKEEAMLDITRTAYALQFDVGSGDHGHALSAVVTWSEYATDREGDEEHEVRWRVNFHSLSMRMGRRVPIATLRTCVVEAIRRHFEPAEGRWSRLEITPGEDGEVNQYDITITYQARMRPSHLETVQGLVHGIAATLGGIIEARHPLASQP